MPIIRSGDVVLECPADHIFWEKFDLPMVMEAYIDRLWGAQRCPKCGTRPRRNAKKGQIMILTGARRQEAIQTQGWTEGI